MLEPNGLCAYNFTYDNWGANPSATPGTSVTPGASNAEGSWTQVASGANIAEDCYWVLLYVFGAASSGVAKNQLLDIGVDPAGGTSYTAVISNLVTGGTGGPGVGTPGHEFLFPWFIKSGSTVAVRVQGSAGTAGTVRVCAKFFGRPTDPTACPVGMISQTFGTITSSNGTALTPGNAADGSYVDLGAASTPLWWFQVGVQFDDTTQSATYNYIEIAAGDATNKRTIGKIMVGDTTGEEFGTLIRSQLAACAAYNPIASGDHIYIRARCNTTPDSNCNATVIGIGG